MVVVEARPLIQQVGHVGLAARGAEIAPAIHRVDFGRLASGVLLDDADRAGVGPLRRLQRGERRGEAAVMRMDALARGAHAGAAPDLVAKAGAATLAVKAERLEAKPMVVCERAQC